MISTRKVSCGVTSAASRGKLLLVGWGQAQRSEAPHHTVQPFPILSKKTVLEGPRGIFFCLIRAIRLLVLAFSNTYSERAQQVRLTYPGIHYQSKVSSCADAAQIPPLRHDFFAYQLYYLLFNWTPAERDAHISRCLALQNERDK